MQTKSPSPAFKQVEPFRQGDLAQTFVGGSSHVELPHLVITLLQSFPVIFLGQTQVYSLK